MACCATVDVVLSKEEERIRDNDMTCQNYLKGEIN
jgi:hypothetical protein